MNNSQAKRIRLIYDTAFAPLSFDIIYSLAICRILSEQHSLQKKLDVCIINNSFREVGVEAKYSEVYRSQKLRDTILSCLPLNSGSTTIASIVESIT